MLEQTHRASPGDAAPTEGRGTTYVALGVVLLGAVVGGAALGASRLRVQAEQIARHERREAALGDYLAGMDLLQRRADVATIGSLAIPAFERAVAMDPTFADAQFALGEAHARIGRAVKATASYRAALRDQPNNAAWLVRMGDHLRTTPGATPAGARRQALDYYRRASETGEAGGAFTKIGSAFLLADAGKHAEAVAAARAATSQAPYLWEAWAALGDTLNNQALRPGEQGWDRSGLENALRAYEEANRLDPENVRCLLAVARALRQLELKEEALEVLDALIEARPNDSAHYTDRGGLHLELGNLEAARRDMDRAVELAPSFVPALVARAEVHRVRGEQDLAIADLTRVVALAPDNASYRVARGTAYMQAKQYALAKDDFKKVIELAPEFHPAWTNLGTALLASGDPAAAEETWTQAIGRLPKTSTAHVLLHRGQMYLNTKRAESAVADLELALSIGQGTSGEPLPPAAPLLLSRAYRAAGRYDDAVALVLRFLEGGLPPNLRGVALRELGDTHGERGRGLLQQGKHAQALEAFDQALKYDPLPSHAYGGALAAVAAGDLDLALRWLDRGFEVGLRDWRAIEKDERLGALLTDPRLRALLERMGAPARE